MPGLFDEPTPYVTGSDTSQERAQREDSTGEASARRTAILDALKAAGPHGMIWREIAAQLGLHHGQASGALSTMHKHGHIAMLTSKRNACHPYVHPDFFAVNYGNLIMAPNQTLAGRKAAAMQDVIDAARDFCNRGLGLGNVVEALRILDSLTD